MKTLSKIKTDVRLHRTAIKLKRKGEIYPSSVVKAMQKNLINIAVFGISRITLARALFQLV